MKQLTFALRMLLKTPFVSGVAILSLGLGIGANTAIFTMFNQVLMQPLPVDRPSELVNLGAPGPKNGSTSCNNSGDCDAVFSYPMYLDLARDQQVFSGLAAHRLFGANVGYDNTTSPVDGAEVSGSTVVPDISPVVAGSRVDVFNRDRDSVRLTWRSATGARSYLVRVESPFGAFLQFTDSTNVTLDGELRNYFASSLERVFIPGFRQRVSIAAVDSNYFDYYRSRNDPFTGSGIIEASR